ncbi:hypothetical protein BC828DRAFT_349702 [Blastocladiella britannica]|nr:hypothetical protein BC828DRAFT_349702 [Blastocladiella britannica]
MNYGFYGFLVATVGDVMGFLGSIPCVFCCPNPYKVVEQGSVGVIKRFGEAMTMVDPGLYKVNVMTDKLQKVDIRLQVVDMPRQLVLTKDNIQATIDTVLYYQVHDPYVVTYLVANVRQALVERTQTVLRQIFGTRTLQECIEMRETIAHDIQAIIAAPAAAWGVKVNSILIKDMTLAQDLQESLSAAAKQKRIGESKIIAAEAEVLAAQLMRQAADALDSQAAMQIRFLETLKAVSATPGTKIVFVPPGNANELARASRIQETL